MKRRHTWLTAHLALLSPVQAHAQAPDEPPAAAFAPVEPQPSAASPPADPTSAPASTSPPPQSPARAAATPLATPPSSPRAQPSALPANSPPPAATPPPEPEGEELLEKGIYFDANAGAVYGIKSTHGWIDDCPKAESSGWEPTCASTVPIGVMIEGRLGYRTGVVGIEGFGLFASDWSSARLEGDEPEVPLPDFASDMHIGRVGGGIGAGLRFMSDGFARVALGVGGGVMLRHVYTNVSSLDGSSEGYVAPILKADLSLTLGKFFNLGIMGWAEFAPDVTVTPDLSAAGGLAGFESDDPQVQELQEAVGDVDVFRGTQFFIGPYIGFHLGK